MIKYVSLFIMVVGIVFTAVSFINFIKYTRTEDPNKDVKYITGQIKRRSAMVMLGIIIAIVGAILFKFVG